MRLTWDAYVSPGQNHGHPRTDLDDHLGRGRVGPESGGHVHYGGGDEDRPRVGVSWDDGSPGLDTRDGRDYPGGRGVGQATGWDERA